MTPPNITSAECAELKKLIREIPDFPKKGILFYDITTLLKDKLGFARLIDALSANYIGKEIDLILGMEARGFIFGPALAYRLNAGFVPVRKPGKQRRDPERPARVDRGRSAGNRRHCGCDCQIGHRPRRANRRPRICS